MRPGRGAEGPWLSTLGRDSHRKVELAAKGIHHDAASVGDVDDLGEEFGIRTGGGNQEFDPGENGRRAGDGGVDQDDNVGDGCVPGGDGGEEVAHEAAADGRQEQFAAHGTGVGAAFIGRTVDGDAVVADGGLGGGWAGLAKFDGHGALPRRNGCQVPCQILFNLGLATNGVIVENNPIASYVKR